MVVRIVRCLALIAVLPLPTLVTAGPISLGTWSTAPAADNDVDPFYDGASWDCDTCGVGHVLESFGTMEYLHGANDPVAFAFDDAAISWTLLSNQTAWTGGIFEYSGGAFSYDNRHGNLYSSLTSPWQFALFRQVGESLTHYFLGIEDISLSARRNDRDYNDFVVTFSLPNPLSVPEPPPDPPQSVPEPSTALLMGTAIVVAAAHRLKTRRFRG